LTWQPKNEIEKCEKTKELKSLDIWHETSSSGCSDFLEKKIATIHTPEIVKF
jgi:hypothetical protein